MAPEFLTLNITLYNKIILFFGGKIKIINTDFHIKSFKFYNLKNNLNEKNPGAGQ